MTKNYNPKTPWQEQIPIKYVIQLDTKTYISSFIKGDIYQTTTNLKDTKKYIYFKSVV